MDKEAWRAAVHGVTKSRTRLRDWTELIWSDILFIRFLYFLSPFHGMKVPRGEGCLSAHCCISSACSSAWLPTKRPWLNKWVPLDTTGAVTNAFWDELSFCMRTRQRGNIGLWASLSMIGWAQKLTTDGVILSVIIWGLWAKPRQLGSTESQNGSNTDHNPHG